ncbi:copper chaperone PCu(A)C [Streptomyces tropicalis]|uniref:Copper chaperone PCu(A)C n=1 Tax=Streptomyces tropicalis TaxID=3034234 RepID=A0ABT6A895_9ACTN|nr:copper chaperone PCu(A)C [Streptomyces tropicalis]MDF3300848.1 copper chaperone PCu(A)C [Streptomyces tropicalis]
MRRAATAAAVTAAALACATLAGCGTSGSGGGRAELSVSAAYMPQPVSDTMAAGFLTITNKGDARDELTSVTSDAAGDVTLHETAGGTMKQAERLTVPAHGRLVFRSGGGHLMFEGLKRRPRQGQTVAVTLHFAASGPVTVEVPVRSATYTPTTGH